MVGGGEIAARKVTLLLKADAAIKLVAPDIAPALRETLKDNRHHLIEDAYESSHLDGAVLVVAATNDEVVNQQISGQAKAQGIPVNVVDAPDLCTVTFPAIIDRSPLVMSVGSAGTSPVLTRTVREWIEALIPERFTTLARYMESRRSKLKEQLPDVETRRRHTEAFMNSPGFEAAMAGRDTEADQHLFQEPEAALGEVYLVGAGPGDPDLLTLRALQLMQRADVVLYDNLVSDRVLDRARRDARREFVGKRSGYKSTAQEDINDLLVRLAEEGHRVLRLKGGDPFIFGRGGEEIEALVQRGIPFQVVPGITAASGCAAYAGIPLTHRIMAHSVRFVTGHPRDGVVDLPWQELTSDKETVVFYMGLGGLASICQQLVKHGRRSDTPVAVVSKGTLPSQRVLKGTLETMPGLVARTQIETPTLTIVGDVVNFTETISRS